MSKSSPVSLHAITIKSLVDFIICLRNKFSIYLYCPQSRIQTMKNDFIKTNWLCSSKILKFSHFHTHHAIEWYLNWNNECFTAKWCLLKCTVFFIVSLTYANGWLPSTISLAPYSTLASNNLKSYVYTK